METIYEKQFEVCSLPLADKPRDSEETVPIGGFLDGCRIGIDVGGSNRKICALCDGKIVYNVTEPWQPLDLSLIHILFFCNRLCCGVCQLPEIIIFR